MYFIIREFGFVNKVLHHSRLWHAIQFMLGNNLTIPLS